MGAGVGGGVNNVTAANFVRLIETIPPLVVVNQKLPILARLEACDSAIRQVLNFFRVNVPTITDAQKVQGFLKSLADSNQAMFVQEDGRRQAQNMPPAERLVEMVKRYSSVHIRFASGASRAFGSWFPFAHILQRWRKPPYVGVSHRASARLVGYGV